MKVQLRSNSTHEQDFPLEKFLALIHHLINKVSEWTPKDQPHGSHGSLFNQEMFWYRMLPLMNPQTGANSGYSPFSTCKPELISYKMYSLIRKLISLQGRVIHYWLFIYWRTHAIGNIICLVFFLKKIML